MDDLPELDERLHLARVRTALAEKRTVLSELQLSIILVTLPLTLHAGVVVLAGSHQLASRLHLLFPFWIVLLTMIVAGLLACVHAVRALVRVNGAIRTLVAKGPG